jgi:hypothetical protein
MRTERIVASGKWKVESFKRQVQLGSTESDSAKRFPNVVPAQAGIYAMMIEATETHGKHGN